MSEIEKAIKCLKQAREYLATEYIKRGLLDKAIIIEDCFDNSIQALQEKLERENGCECCNHHVPVKNFAKEYSIEVDDLEVSLWEDLKCLATIKINYCPMCGRRLEHIGEATNIVEGE